jgi:hypothetical protein
MAIPHFPGTTGRSAMAAWSALTLALLAPGRVVAQGTLQKDLAEVAKDIKTLLAERGEDSLSVGQFTGPATLPTSAGPGIAQLLSEELKKLGLTVKVRANVGVEGKYRDVKVKETGLLAVELTVNVVDRSGKSLLKDERRIGVFNEGDIAALLGLTVSLPAQEKEKDRSQRLEKAIDKSKAHIDGTHISASADSPYGVEILVAASEKGPFEPRKPTLDDGLAFVDIKRGEFYRVRLINGSEHQAAVRLTIDGLNMFDFSKVKNAKGEPFSQVILRPGKQTDIKGWSIDERHTDAFVVTEYAKSAAAELKSTAKTGTITVTFSAAWPKDGQPPADEPEKAGPRSAGGDATGRGPTVPDKFVEVRRAIGVVRATVSVRYTK